MLQQLKMPFSTGEGGLLQLNQESFDFNVQFEQLFFSMIPSVLFIATSLWRTVSQARKPTVVDAPVFQLIKLVTSPPRDANEFTTCANLTAPVYHYNLCRPRTFPPHLGRGWVLPCHEHVHSLIGPQACFRLVHDNPQRR